MTRTLRHLLPTLTALLLLTACNSKKVYDRYTEVSTEGWEKNEPIVFGIDSLKVTGQYSLVLGLRISDTYPFRNLEIVVDQTVFPSRQKYSEVIECQVTDRNGLMLGHGMSMFQYYLPVSRRFYMNGDSISVSVRHNMKREILPGILDVGVTLKR